MVKIENLTGDSKIVTKGAFESFYKPLGYQIVNAKNVNKNVKDATFIPSENNKTEHKSTTRK